MRRRITGLELGGRFDVAARDWSTEDPDAIVDPPQVVSGGAAASVVMTRDGHRPIRDDELKPPGCNPPAIRVPSGPKLL